MRRNSNSWSLFGVITVYAMMSCCEGRIVLPPNVTVPAVFAFGDSIVDQGANNHVATLIKCNFQPYGKDLHGFGPTGRFSNGKTPPDFIGNVARMFINTIHLIFLVYRENFFSKNENVLKKKSVTSFIGRREYCL